MGLPYHRYRQSSKLDCHTTYVSGLSNTWPTVMLGSLIYRKYINHERNKILRSRLSISDHDSSTSTETRKIDESAKDQNGSHSAAEHVYALNTHDTCMKRSVAKSRERARARARERQTSILSTYLCQNFCRQRIHQTPRHPSINRSIYSGEAE